MKEERVRYFKVPEFADELNVSPKMIWNWIAIRRLAVLHVGRSVRIPETELNRLIQEGSVPARRS
jgi:excisionase family DNA binding protein